jgi:hypothetical protein
MRDELTDAARAFARLVAALERQRPLCPDHRDKAGGYPCLLCEIERLRTDNHHLRGLLETAVDAWECGLSVVDRHNKFLPGFRGACLPEAWWDEARKAGGLA